MTDCRAHQRLLLDHAVDRLRGGSSPLPAIGAADVRLAGLATGLTALIAHLTDDGRTAGTGGTGGMVDPAIEAWLAEQRAEVAARVDRFRALVPTVRGHLAAAGVPAVAVKGAELVAGDRSVWGIPAARPMADVDLVIPRRLRGQATAALCRAGLRHEASTGYEDVFLAWGDGSIGRTDGESASHNGRVELHPDWTEFVHGYVVRGVDLIGRATPDPALPGGYRLALGALTAHVIGHLSSTVVRAEVRAVNAVDVWWCHQAGVDWDEVATICREMDPRLTAPAMWFVHETVPDVVPVRLLSSEFDRLPRAARRALDGIAPEDALRDPVARTTARWRSAFASGRERVAVVDQMAFPDGDRSPQALRRRLVELARR